MPIRHQTSIPSLIIAPHSPSFTQFMKVKAGEIVTIGKEDDHYPGWVWCTDSRGVSNWVPKEFLRTNGVEARAEFLVDYDATELTVQVGETVIVYSEQSGWLWCQTVAGQWGWIPKECVAR